MSDNKTRPVPRREFLKKAGLAAGAVGAAAATLPASPAHAATEQATGSTDAGYRETEHVLKYYETARF